jgi:protein TonB
MRRVLHILFRREPLLLFLAVSILAHMAVFQTRRWLPETGLTRSSKAIAVDFVGKRRPPPVKKPRQPEAPKVTEPKSIVDTPMPETNAPEVASYLGRQNHATDKETKVEPRQGPRKPAPPLAIKGRKQGVSRDEVQRRAKALQQLKGSKRFEHGSVETHKGLRHNDLAKLSFNDLMPSEDTLLQVEEEAYREYIAENIEHGDVVSLNTKEYRYVSYFSTIKRRIELVWKYPEAAAMRGIQGQTTLEMTLKRDGSVERVRVVQSSGYPLLDNEAVTTIRMCSPFNPIPDQLDTDRLVVEGTFVYRLSYFSIN